jgi:hypothetical protein
MKRELFLVMLMLVGAGLPRAEASSKHVPTVTIRTYNYAQVSPERLANARLTTDVIFRRAGISLQWVECRVPQSDAGAPCLEPLAQGRDLILRLMNQAPADVAAGGRVLTLGTSMLDREQRRGVLMTVDLLPIRTIAADAATDEPTLLGRAIAHEIGHLLLGSSEHARYGLMRALWSHDELRGIKSAHWQFSADEAARIQFGLLKAARTAN